MQPNGVSVPSDELVHVHAADRRRAFHPLLLPMDENGHELLPPSLPLPLLSRRELSFTFRHLSCCWNPAPNARHEARRANGQRQTGRRSPSSPGACAWPPTQGQLAISVAYDSRKPQLGQRYVMIPCCSFPRIFVPTQKDGSGRPATQRVTVTTLLVSPGIKPASISVPHLRHLGAVLMLVSMLLATTPPLTRAGPMTPDT